MYEDVKIKESLLGSDGITFNPVLGAAYILERDGLSLYQMSQDYSEVVFGYWGRSTDPETGSTNLCIYPPIGSYYENIPECVGYYRGRVTYDGEEYDSWYWDNHTYTIIYTDIITDIVEVEVKPFFDFMNYCPKLDTSIRTKLWNGHSTDVLRIFEDASLNVTLAQASGSNAYTTYSLNGTNLYLFRMSGIQGDTSTNDPQKTYTYTSVGSYALYMGTSTMSSPVILTPFYYYGVNFCNPNISFSYIFPQTDQNGDGTSYGTQWKKVYLPEFTCSSATANSMVTINKLHGPYDCDICNERLIIIWDRIDKTIKPKYFLRYTDRVSNIPSNLGTGLYGQPLKKVIEIE